MKCIKVSQLCRVEGNPAPFMWMVCVTISGSTIIPVFFAQQVSSVACCEKMMTGHFQNCPPTALSQQGFGCNSRALELFKFYFFLGECVLADVFFFTCSSVCVQNFKNNHNTPTISPSYLQPCPLLVAVSAGGRSSPGGRTECVSFSPSVSPCNTGYAPETQDVTVRDQRVEAHHWLHVSSHLVVILDETPLN